MLRNQDAIFFLGPVHTYRPRAARRELRGSMPFPWQGIAVDHSHHLALQFISGVSIASNASFVLPAPEGIEPAEIALCTLNRYLIYTDPQEPVTPVLKVPYKQNATKCFVWPRSLSWHEEYLITVVCSKIPFVTGSNPNSLSHVGSVWMPARSSPWKKHDLFPALLRNCMSWQQHEHVGQAGRVRLRGCGKPKFV